jgi:hypothetical protein
MHISDGIKKNIVVDMHMICILPILTIFCTASKIGVSYLLIVLFGIFFRLIYFISVT